MSIQPEHLAIATVVIFAALALVTLAITVLRRVERYLSSVILAVGICWGVMFAAMQKPLGLRHP